MSRIRWMEGKDGSHSDDVPARQPLRSNGSLSLDGIRLGHPSEVEGVVISGPVAIRGVLQCRMPGRLRGLISGGYSSDSSLAEHRI